MLSRREFVSATLAAGALVVAVERRRANAAAGFELEEMTLAAMAEGMASGRFTAHKLAEMYLGRIGAVDAATVRCMLGTNPDALRDADALDAERKAGKVRGPLHGIPIVVKGNIDTADKLTTTAGALAMAGHVAKRDATVIEKLRAAGCVILGKTNLSEWANFRSTHSSSGWSGEGGQTRNAYALDRSPSGSSSGSASAVAGNLAAIAVGTETDGSILSPSSCQGLVGIKPTVGLVSRAGIIPIAHSQDTAGPMARTVADAAALLAAMAGSDPRDAATSGARIADYSKSLDKGALRGARLGVLHRDPSGGSPAAERVFADALKLCKDLGAEIVDDALTAGRVGDAEFDVLLYEFKADLDAYLADAGAAVKSLAEVITWNNEHAKESMPIFGQEILIMAQKKGPLSDAAYKKARAKCLKVARTGGLEAALKKHRLDAIVAPTGGPAWLIDHINGDSGGGYSSTELAAVSGTPSITVPAGWEHGLPLGMSFMGPAWSEARLIALAYSFEQASKARKPAEFKPTADVP